MISKLIYLRYRDKLKLYNGFKKENYTQWVKQKRLSFFVKCKILKYLRIISAQQIREAFRKYVEDESNILQDVDYIISFGQAGKSGDILLYELRHSRLISQKKFIRIDELTNARSGSKVLFVDDLVGTGKQSTEYINNKLYHLIPSGVEVYLLTLFATNTGISFVESNTNIEKVIPLSLIDETESILNHDNSMFSTKEKINIEKINSFLRSDTSNYDFYFLLCFYYAIPNNSCQILWKNNFQYLESGISHKWNALLPSVLTRTKFTKIQGHRLHFYCRFKRPCISCILRLLASRYPRSLNLK